MANPEAGADDFLANFLDDYFAECDEHLTTVRRLLAETQPGLSNGMPAETVEDLFRAFHSIKGLSGMVELRDAEELAHQMESYLRLLRGRETILTSSGLDALIGGTSLLERVISARRSGIAGPSIQAASAALDAIVRTSSAPPSATPALPARADRASAAGERWRVMFAPSPELAGRGVTVDRVRTRLAQVGRIVEAAPSIGEAGSIRFEFTLEDVADGSVLDRWRNDGISARPIVDDPVVPAPDPVTPAGGALTSSHFVRVDLGRLDELMRMMGDLVITRARLSDSLTRLERHVPAVAWRAVQENGQAMERQLRDLREGVMRVRLVRIGEIFERMPFVVRDLARESGRQVELEITGQETEIDKYLVERMMDPVLHLVRNAVSHGIEPAAERERLGKRPVGHLKLSAASVGDLVILEISDDGRGVDQDAVLRRARAAGIHVGGDAPTAAELLNILCAPGFSTRDSADRAAGRGVGMAVVQSTVRELGGTVTLDTAPGEGTRFLIELPLTLAITDAIIAVVGGQTFAVPQASVREVIGVPRDAIRSVEKGEIIPYRGGVLPLLRLATLFGLTSRPGVNLHVFVIGSGPAAVGVVVDRIQTQREIVVRPISDPLIKSEGVTGATDLGDGRVVLIVDLVRAARRAIKADA